MKTISRKSQVAFAVALVILLGANSAETPSLLELLSPPKPAKHTLESAHAAMQTPIPDEQSPESDWLSH